MKVVRRACPIALQRAIAMPNMRLRNRGLNTRRIKHDIVVSHLRLPKR